MVYRSHRGHINFMGFVLGGHQVESNTFKKGSGPDVFSPGIAGGETGYGTLTLICISATA